MAGFTAINIGMRIPGMLGKLKQLAELPLRLVMASAESGEHGGVMGLVRSASHLFKPDYGQSCGQQWLPHRLQAQILCLHDLLGRPAQLLHAQHC